MIIICKEIFQILQDHPFKEKMIFAFLQWTIGAFKVYQNFKMTYRSSF